jgi:hypothetical protein
MMSEGLQCIMEDPIAKLPARYLTTVNQIIRGLMAGEVSPNQTSFYFLPSDVREQATWNPSQDVIEDLSRSFRKARKKRDHEILSQTRGALVHRSLGQDHCL